MKVIPKKQQGGSLSSFFVNYAPVQRGQQQASQQPTQSSKPKDDGKLTEKDLFDMIGKIDGLPNEMKHITDNLIATFRMTELTGQSTTSLATKYLSNLYQIKVAAQNKENFDNAFKNAQTNGALAEPAITLDGKLVVQNTDGKIQKVELSDYIKNTDQYYALSVSQLANLRKFDPAMIQNQGAIDIINNGIGYEGFQNLISKSLRSLGSDTHTREGLFNTDAARQGLALIQRLSEDDQVQALGSITAEGLYKHKVIDKTQLNQINALTRYLAAVLPDRAKTWAAYKMGIDDKNKATSALIQQFLLQGNNQEHSFTIDYKAADKGKSGSGSSSQKSEDKTTFLTALQRGYGAGSEKRTLNLGDNMNFTVSGSMYGGFMDTEDKPLYNVNLEQLMNEAGISGISNNESISFGDQLIPSNLLSKVSIKNNGGFRAILPCVKKDGKVVPNFPLINEFSKVVNDVIEESGDSATYEQRMELLEEKIRNTPELYELLNMQGKLDPDKVQPFFIVDGLASDLNFGFEESPFLHTTDNQADIDYFKSTTSTEDFDTFEWFKPFDWLNAYDKLYESKVFIPLQNNNRLSAIIFSGQRISNSNSKPIEQEYQSFNTASQMVTPSSDLLWGQ